MKDKRSQRGETLTEIYSDDSQINWTLTGLNTA